MNWLGVDINTITGTGFYQFANGINTPTPYGFLFSFLQPNSSTAHIFLSTQNRLFTRLFVGTSWTAWKEY